jgi:predicted site-specific integrase-resolvase
MVRRLRVTGDAHQVPKQEAERFKDSSGWLRAVIYRRVASLATLRRRKVHRYIVYMVHHSYRATTQFPSDVFWRLPQARRHARWLAHQPIGC